MEFCSELIPCTIEYSWAAIPTHNFDGKRRSWCCLLHGLVSDKRHLSLLNPATRSNGNKHYPSVQSGGATASIFLNQIAP